MLRLQVLAHANLRIHSSLQVLAARPKAKFQRVKISIQSFFTFPALQRNSPTTGEQGAAPDRLQLHSFHSSFLLIPFIALPAAGELSVRRFAKYAFSGASFGMELLAHREVCAGFVPPRFFLCGLVLVHLAFVCLASRCQRRFAALLVSCVLAFRLCGAAASTCRQRCVHFRFRAVAWVSLVQVLAACGFGVQRRVSSLKRCHLAFIVSRRKFARKSPTKCRTRRCTRPPTAPFAAFRSCLASLRSFRFRRRVSLSLCCLRAAF